MYHIVYKTTSPSGKYYIGRHSTHNLNDGYIGSGKWVKSMKKTKKLLCEILRFCSSEKEVKYTEYLFIEAHIGKKGCMNFALSNHGFGVGKTNACHDPIVKEKRSKNHWTKTAKGKLWAKEHNPSKLEKVKVKRRLQAQKQIENGSCNFLRKDVIAKTIAISRTRFLECNPAKIRACCVACGKETPYSHLSKHYVKCVNNKKP